MTFIDEEGLYPPQAKLHTPATSCLSAQNLWFCFTFKQVTVIDHLSFRIVDVGTGKEDVWMRKPPDLPSCTAHLHYAGEMNYQTFCSRRSPTASSLSACAPQRA